MFLAASERRPLVAGYLAETMSALRIPLNQTYEKGNTVIHYLAMWGDDYNEVLRYLVRVRAVDNKLAFDLNARNHTGKMFIYFVSFHSFDHVFCMLTGTLDENRTFCSPRNCYALPGERSDWPRFYQKHPVVTRTWGRCWSIGIQRNFVYFLTIDDGGQIVFLGHNERKNSSAHCY